MNIMILSAILEGIYKSFTFTNLKKKKNLPFWLKFGIIAFLISLIPSLIILLFNCDLFNFLTTTQAGICKPIIQLVGIMFPVFIPGLLLVLLISTTLNAFGINLFMFWIKRILGILVFFGFPFFVIGTIVGFLYGKAKKQKMKKQDVARTALIFIAIYTLLAILSFLALKPYITDTNNASYISSTALLFLWPFIISALILTFGGWQAILINDILGIVIFLLLIWLSRYIDKKIT